MKTKFNLFALGISLAAVCASWSQEIIFTPITDGDIVNDAGSFTRSAWGDFNNDDRLDLFVSNYDNLGANVFYWNNGGGAFTTLTQGDPVQDAAEHTGAAA